MGGERHIENSRLDTAVFDDVQHGGDKNTSVPGDSAAGFEDDMEMGPALAETLQDFNEVRHVVVFAGHQVAATEVDPFESR